MTARHTNFLQHNISLLRQHRPALLAVADTAVNPVGFKISLDQEGRPNIQAPLPVSNTPEFVHDPGQADESFLGLLELLKNEPESIIFWVGMGLGYEAELFLEKFPLVRLIIMEPNAALFQEALKARDLSSILSSPNVSLHVGKDVNIPQLLTQEDDALRALPMNLVSLQKLQNLFPDVYKPLYSSLQAELLHFKGRLQTIIKQGPLLFRNTLANIPRLPSSASIMVLKGIAQGLPAVCVASGPSLTKNVEQLKGRQNDVFIIAVDSAAQILISHGITPHIIVTIDPIPLSMTKLRDVIAAHPELPLAWTPESFPETVQGFQNGPKFVIPGVNDLFRIYLAPLFEEAANFTHMLSVTHAATQLAMVSGCNPIIFIGLDLALCGGKDHAEGSPVSWGNLAEEPRIKIPGWHGDEVETISVLHNQLLALQKIICQNSAAAFIDASEGGALIAGTEVMPFSEVLARYADKQMAIDMVIENIFSLARKPIGQNANHILQELQKSLKASRKIAQDGLNNGKEAIRHWKLSKIPNKKTAALQKFKKNIVASGTSFDRLMDQLALANALYPLRAAAHHEFIYSRKKFNAAAPSKTPEQRILGELELNLQYFDSWLATTKQALAIIEPVLKEMAGLRTED